MAKNIKDVAITTETIAEKLGMKTAAVSEKFNSILKYYGFSEKQKKMFLSVSEKGGKGKYMFASLDAVKKIFDIYDENKLITVEEREKLIECFTELLPTFIETDSHKKLYKETQNANMKEVSTAESSNFTFDKEYLKLDMYNTYIGEIERIITRYYVHKVINDRDYFEERIFVSVDTAQVFRSIRAKIYGYQYELISEWKEKWMYILNIVNKIRETEEFDNKYKICDKDGIHKENRKKALEQDGLLDDYLKEEDQLEIGDLYEYVLSEFEEKLKKKNAKQRENCEKGGKKLYRDECLKKCKEKVEEILNHDLIRKFQDDFKYLIKEAFEELEIVRKQVLEREKREYYCSMDTKNDIRDFDDLYKIRDIIRKKTRLITDYK